jgi:hypothetical protein
VSTLVSIRKKTLIFLKIINDMIVCQCSVSPGIGNKYVVKE